MTILFAPFLYLRVTHERKWLYDWVLPLLVGSMAALAKHRCGDTLNVFGDRGLLEHQLSLLLILTGFFIGALGVVSTINKPSIDRYMVGPNPARLRGERISRRRYLALMFGYLALCSMLMYVAGTGAQIISPTLKGAAQPPVDGLVEVVFVGTYVSAFANILITTMIGLYYLSERLFREEEEDKLPLPDPSSVGVSEE